MRLHLGVRELVDLQPSRSREHLATMAAEPPLGVDLGHVLGESSLGGKHLVALVTGVIRVRRLHVLFQHLLILKRGFANVTRRGPVPVANVHRYVV